MVSRLLTLFLVGLVSIAAACGILSEAVSPEVHRLACYAKAFEPLAGTYERAQELVEHIQSGEIDIHVAVASFDATEAELADLAKALEGCRVVDSDGGAGASGTNE